MLVKRGFWWLVGAALAGLLPALLLASQVVRVTVETATLARLAEDAARLATAPLGMLPAEAWLLAADGSRVAPDVSGEAGPPEELVASLARRAATAPLRLNHPAGLFASYPLAAVDGGVRGAVALWQPAARIEARVTAIVLRGLRDAALIGALCIPAAWIGARLLLTPLAVSARHGINTLEALRQADLATTPGAAAIDASAVTTGAPPGADPLVRNPVATDPLTSDPLVTGAANAAADLLARLAATEVALLCAVAPPAPA